MRRYALRDDQWDRIKDILPGREGHLGVTAKDNRLFVEAVIYRYRPASLGETCQNGLATRSRYIRASRAGPRAGCGRSYLRCWRAMQIMSTP
jgi:transposase